MINLLDFIKISGNSIKKFEGQKKYIATGDVIDNKIISYNNVTYDNKPSRANVKCEVGDIIFAKMKDTLKVLKIDDSNVDNIYSTGFFCVTPQKDYDIDFIYWLLNSSEFNRLKNKYSKGATQSALNNENLKKIELLNKPSIQEQKDISFKLNKLSHIINLIKEQSSNLDELIKSQFVKKNKLAIGGVL